MLPQSHRTFVVLFVTFITATVFGSDHAEEDEEHPPVSLNSPFGPITGTKDKSRDGRLYYQFKGIPYGHVPARFMDSVEVPPWTESHEASDYGSPCVQHGMGAEECLFINVFTPSLPSDGPAKYPVLVWIHGGYFVSGSSDLYSPQYFMDQDVVVVTLNYRLTAFGFLNLGIEDAPGNQGLKDQVLALKWVQKNIKYFNGDETSVTIFGESAGGASVSYLVLSPLARGLFHRAISQSGTAACAWAYNASPEETAIALASKLGCGSGSKSEMVECLRKLDATDVIKATPSFLSPKKDDSDSDAECISFVPSREDREATDKAPVFLPKSPMEMLKELPQDSVPWIVGFNAWEGYVFTHDKLKPPVLGLSSPEEVKAKLRETGPKQFKYSKRPDKDEISDKIHDFYFGDRTEVRENLTIAITDVMFLHCSVSAAQLYAEKGPVYFYEFEEPGGFSLVSYLLRGDIPPLPGHADEMTYQWHYDSPFIDPEICDIPAGHKQYGFSKEFVKLWVHFAIHGKPMGEWIGKPLSWQPLASPLVDDQMWLHLKEDAAVLPVCEGVKRRLDFMEQLNITLAY